MDAPAAPVQAPAAPIMILVQEALAHILSVCTSLAQVISATTVVSTLQAEGGNQTPAARTPEQRHLERFGRLQPPSFSGAEGEEAYGFLDKRPRMLRTATILETSGVASTTFQFSGVAFTWWEAYERHTPVGTVPLTWHEFSTLFLEKYVPQSRREELHRQFEWLRQGDMTVSQYESRFSKLDRHAICMVPIDRERIRRFVDGLNYHLRILMTRDRVLGATFEEVVDIAREIKMVRYQDREERKAKRPRGSGNYSGAPSRGQF
ncbi:uncharacterized protein [Nicotiana sylvestris]|uniref:uncharacterized protein n=1 Tax=Nicotiana sylvestris TaxID=4096 RepID=UPI00388C957B